HLVTRAPEQFEQSGSRWKLESVRQAGEWLKPLTLSGVCRVLDRLGIALKRGRDYVHSPDVNYVEKLADIVVALEPAANSGGRVVTAFADQFTSSRQPSLAREYCPVGSAYPPLANRSHRSDLSERIIGALDAISGKTTSLMASKMTVSQLVKFLQALREAYPEAEVIYLVVDNWPVHFHPDVLAALAPQPTRWELNTPPSWPTEPRAKAYPSNLP